MNSRKFSADRPLTDAEEAEIQAQIAADPDSAELTAEDAAGRMTFAEAVKRGRGRPKLNRPKQNITLRLSADVLDYFRSTGPGWQARIDEVLSKAIDR